jgi:hypothetical protein
LPAPGRALGLVVLDVDELLEVDELVEVVELLEVVAVMVELPCAGWG